MGDIAQNTVNGVNQCGGQLLGKAQRTGTADADHSVSHTEGQADRKAARIMIHKYGVSLWTLEAMATTSIFLKLKNRENVGVSPDEVVDFSAKTKNTQRRIRDGIRDGIERGLFDEFATPGGKAIDLTDQGESILRDYIGKYYQIRHDWEAKTLTARMEEQSARIERRGLKRQRIALERQERERSRGNE